MSADSSLQEINFPDLHYVVCLVLFNINMIFGSWEELSKGNLKNNV